jgi:hypothetical protein
MFLAGPIGPLGLFPECHVTNWRFPCLQKKAFFSDTLHFNFAARKLDCQSTKSSKFVATFLKSLALALQRSKATDGPVPRGLRRLAPPERTIRPSLGLLLAPPPPIEGRHVALVAPRHCPAEGDGGRGTCLRVSEPAVEEHAALERVYGFVRGAQGRARALLADAGGRGAEDAGGGSGQVVEGVCY